jgi:GTP cyclohydrolase II
MRFQELMPDVLNWMGIRRIDQLASMSDEVWSIMLMTGLDKIFETAPDTMTALARVQLAGGEKPEG